MLSFNFAYIPRADQFDYVMYGKVYKIEGDETSTEAATRLWVMFLALTEAMLSYVKLVKLISLI